MEKPNQNNISISTIYRKTVMWKNEQSAALGLSSAQVPIIIQVVSANGISQNEVVSLLSMEKSVIAKTIGKLVEDGYIERKINPKDKRAYDLYPTEKAIRVYPILVEQGKKWIEIITAGMTADEKRQFAYLLSMAEKNAIEYFNK